MGAERIQNMERLLDQLTREIDLDSHYLTRSEQDWLSRLTAELKQAIRDAYSRKDDIDV